VTPLLNTVIESASHLVDSEMSGRTTEEETWLSVHSRIKSGTKNSLRGHLGMCNSDLCVLETGSSDVVKGKVKSN